MIAPNLTHWKKFRKLCCPRWKKHSKNFSVYVILNVLQYLSQILNCDLSENVSMLWSAKQVTFDQTRKPLRFHQRAWNYEVNVCQFCHDSGYQSALYLTFFFPFSHLQIINTIIVWLFFSIKQRNLVLSHKN